MSTAYVAEMYDVTLHIVSSLTFTCNYFILGSLNYNMDFRSRWTLSAGEAEPPRSLRFLWGLDFLAFPAGVATFYFNQLKELKLIINLTQY